MIFFILQSESYYRNKLLFYVPAAIKDEDSEEETRHDIILYMYMYMY